MDPIFLAVVLVVLCAAVYILYMFVRASNEAARLRGLLEGRDAAAGAGGNSQAGAAHYSLPVLTECSTCEHFDLEEGQAQLREHGSFMAASQHITPSMMTREKKYDPSGNPLAEAKPLADGSPLSARDDVLELAGAQSVPDEGVDVVEIESHFEYVSTVPAKMQWQDVGACSKHAEGRWKHDKCDEFLFQAHRKAS